MHLSLYVPTVPFVLNIFYFIPGNQCFYEDCLKQMHFLFSGRFNPGLKSCWSRSLGCIPKPTPFPLWKVPPGAPLLSWGHQPSSRSQSIQASPRPPHLHIWTILTILTQSAGPGQLFLPSILFRRSPYPLAPSGISSSGSQKHFFPQKFSAFADPKICLSQSLL